MRSIITSILCFFVIGFSYAQTPVNMASQANFTYTETFADIDNWVFNTTPADGTFTSGIGARAWKGSLAGGSGTIPTPGNVTVATVSFPSIPAGNVTSSSSGVQKYFGKMLLLSTGTTNNTTSTIMDFYMDFTGLNAGTLSFDWSALNNGTGDRAGSVRVYASTDGTTFEEITGAAVLNVANNSGLSGSINFVTLPSRFNNSPTARLRFYNYNGTGGTTGSRPKLLLDNIKVTAVSANACTTPTTQPTAFLKNTIGYTSIQASFTAANPAAQGYLILMSNNSLPNNPVNGKNYAVGDNIGDATVVSFGNSTTFNATGLNPATQYYFTVYSMNNLCTGGPLYYTNTPLQDVATTLNGSEPCAAPATQPMALTFSNIKPFSVFGNFKPSANASQYLIVASTSSTLSATPVNGTVYDAGSTFGNGTIISYTQATSFTANNLLSGTPYYFYVFAVNAQNCTSGPAYATVNPLTNSVTTTTVPVCAAPIAQPTALQLVAGNNAISGYFTASTSADAYLILYSTSSTLTQQPQNNTNYSVGNTLGNATVVSISNATSFIVNNLTASSGYYFYVFAKNQTCSGGTKYLTTSPLTGTATTTAVAINNYYFGNLHAHSVYSDGGKDNSGTTPAAAYAYAKNSLCMDYLGISEHNHSEAGMSISNWLPGINQAAAATSANFLALYGMEYGVISNGGHVLVYGVDKLLGWEPGNYNVFVPKSDYTGTIPTTGTTGLFKVINEFGNNAFTSLAHPNFSDYNAIANNPFNANADSAIAGCALSSGPANSTSTSYNDPASSLNYYDYYKVLLSKGYHTGPTMDHDNHYTTFGRTSTTRTVFVAPSLSNAEFLKAMKARHFYATEDCDNKASFTINNQIMGSIFTGTTPPAISVSVTDPTNPSAIARIKIMYGVPGNSITAVTLDSATANTFSFTDFNLANGSTAYYFAEITLAGNKVITSPIWYTYNNGTLPVTLVNFTANVTTNKTVALNWSTASEISNKLFVVERSADGVNFTAVDSVAGNGNSSVQNNYAATDSQPLDGINYYRLKQVDKDGKATYSNVVTVNINKAAINYFSVYPNPVSNTATLSINAAKEQAATLVITDVYGRMIQTQPLKLVKGNQLLQLNTASLTAGTYNATILFNDVKVSQKIIKL